MLLTLWCFTATSDLKPFGLIGFLNKAAKNLVYSYPPKCSQAKVDSPLELVLVLLPYREASVQEEEELFAATSSGSVDQDLGDEMYPKWGSYTLYYCNSY